MRPVPDHISEQRGAGLTELMISLSVLSSLTMGGMVVYNRSQTSLREMNYASTMQIIANSIETALQNPDVIMFSITHPDNMELKNCIKADKTTRGRVDSVTAHEKNTGDMEICMQTDPMQQYPALIILPPSDWKNNTEEIASYVDTFAIAAGGENIVKYDINGRRGCQGNAKKCPYEARAWFWAVCPRNAKEIRTSVRGGDSLAGVGLNVECDRAQSINIRYQVTHNEKSVGKGTTRLFQRRLHSIPRDDIFWQDGEKHKHSTLYSDKHTTYNAITHSVSQLGRYSDFTGFCKTNFTLVAIEDSKPICKCLPPYSLKGTGKKSYCILDKHYCKADERYMGTELNGKAICEKVHCESYDLEVDDIEKTGSTLKIDCDTLGRVGGWLWKIETSEHCHCFETRNTKKSNSYEIEYECNLLCPFTLTCCYEQ